MLKCSGLFLLFVGLVVWSAERAFADFEPVGECNAQAVVVKVAALDECKSERGWYRFDGSVPQCKLGVLKDGQEASINITPSNENDTKGIKVCTAADNEESILVASRGGYTAHQIAEIRVNSIETDDSEGDGVVLEPAAAPKAETFQLTSRQILDPWITFAANTPADVVDGVTTSEIEISSVQDLREWRLGFTTALDVGVVSYAGHSVDGGSESDVGIVLIPTDNSLMATFNDEFRNLNSFSVFLVNEFGEQAALTVFLTLPFFETDDDLVAKETNLALVTKIAADEAFLRATGPCIRSDPIPGSVEPLICRKHEQARRLYEKAMEAIPCKDAEPDFDGPCSDEAQSATRAMLSADIAYRLKLIQWNLPFAGGYAALKPTTPHHERIRMKALLDEMEQLIKQINDLERDLYNATVDGQRINSTRVYELGQSIARQIDERAQELRGIYETIDISDFEAQQDAILKDIAYFQSRQEILEMHQENLEKQSAKLLRQGLAVVSGVPLDQIEAAASGDLRDLAESYVQSELETLGNDLIASSKSVKAITDQVGEVEAAVKAFDDVKRDAARIELALTGDRESIRALARDYGSDQFNTFLTEAEALEAEVNDVIALTRAVDRKRALEFLTENILTVEQQAEIKRISDEIKPIERVFNAAYAKVMEKGFEQAMLDEFEIQFAKAISAARPGRDEINRMRNEVRKVYKANVALLKDPYFVRQAVLAVSQMSDRDREVVAAVVTLDPFFLLDVPSVRVVLDQMAPAERARVEAELRTIGEKNGRYVEKRNGRICFTRDPQRRCINLGGVQNRFKDMRDRNGGITQDALKRFLDNHIDDLSDNGVIILYLAKDGAGGFGSNLADLFEGNESRLQRAWDGLDFTHDLFKNEIPGQSRSFTEAEVLVAESLTATQVRRKLQEQELPDQTDPPNTGSRQFEPLDLTGGSSDPATDMALQGALNYALPGAGIALQLGQTWASMDAARDLHEDYRKRMAAAIREQDRLVRSKQLATRRAALARLEHDRAIAISDAGQRQIEAFDLAISTTMNRRTYLRERINLYRPHLYYLAESLRERFEAFDRSLSDWSEGRAEGGILHRKILEDPGNTRFALDSEIQLFNWLNRNIESTRTSPFVLIQHWRQSMRLVDEYCDEHSCKPGDGKFGNIGTTERLRLFEDLMSESEHQAFKAWRDDKNRGGTHSVYVAILPDAFSIPDDYLNIRLLDVTIMPYDRKGDRLSGNRVRLTHTGGSKLVVRDQNNPSKTNTIRHQLLRKRAMVRNEVSSLDHDSMRTRFNDQTNPSALQSLRDFEGYGLDTTFLLEIIDGNSVRQIEDFQIELNYIYTDPTNIESEQDFFSRAEEECSGTGDSFDSGEVWTGALCNQAARIEYRAVKLNNVTGELECSSNSDEMFIIELGDREEADVFRNIGTIKAGNQDCLTVDSTPKQPVLEGSKVSKYPPFMAVDSTLLRTQGACSESEINLRAAFGINRGGCYAQRDSK